MGWLDKKARIGTIMRFHLIERIVTVEPSKSLTAVKNLTLGEEYLGDHFPGFPVMPGVLMLQTLIEAASWLLRSTEEYRFSIIAMREAKNVKYGTFMEPGKSLSIHVEILELGDQTAVFKGKGESGGQSTVSGRFTLARYNLAEKNPLLAGLDQEIIESLKRRYRLLTLSAMKG